MKRLEQIDAKCILEEGYSAYDGLTRAGPAPLPLRAGESGTVLRTLTFQQEPPRPVRAVALAFRGKRYLKCLWRKEPDEVGYERRIGLRRNGRPVTFDAVVRRGDEVESRTRSASDWTWVWLNLADATFGTGDRLTVSFRFDRKLPAPVVAITYRIPLFLADDRGGYAVEGPLLVPVVGAEAVKLCVDVPSITCGGPIRLRVSALDRIGNLDPALSDTLLCSVGEQEALVALDGGRAETTELMAPAAGMHTVRVRGLDSGLEGQSNYFLVDPERGNGMLVWGDIHGHSISSDGIGMLDDHYTYARDVRFMDVAAVTDHDNQIIANGAWPTIQRKAREWSEAGRFIVLPGYEWAQPYEAERNYGHKNFYFRTYADNPLLSGDAGDGTDAETPEKLYARLDPEECVIISHHPAYESWMWTDWDRVDAAREQVIEVYSMHGASDEVETIKPLPDFDPDRFILKNLRERPELRLGFVGGSDVHAGLIAQDFHPDRADPADRIMFKPYRGGITALWVEELSLGAVLEALRRRMTYATTGEKLLLLVEVNEHEFEPELQGCRRAELRVRFGGTARVRSLEVYRNAAACHRVEDLDEAFEYRWEDPQFAPPASYFVRVTQEDDQMAWSSVTWLE